MSAQTTITTTKPAATPTADAGKVRLGGLGPVFRDVKDAGKVRLGGLGPLFR